MLSVHLTCNCYDDDLNVVKWKRGDPFPTLGASVGVDTETELITDSNFTPPLVTLGCYNPADNTCYIVSYIDAQAFMQELLKRDTKIYLANAGFDYFELESKELCQAVTENRVIDVLIRADLKEISSIGFIRTYSLKDCCKNHLDYLMDKHEDEGDASVRLNFSRDRELTDEECQYLALDCITTYLCGEAVGPMPTECTHTKGQIVLYHISKNGFPVDSFMFNYCEALLQAEKEKYRQQLLSFGFPDPYKKKQQTDMERLEESWSGFLRSFVAKHINESYSLPYAVPGKNECKKAFIYMSYYMSNGAELSTLTRALIVALGKKTNMNKAEKEAWICLTESYPFLCACDTATKKAAWPMLLERYMIDIDEGKNIDQIMEDLEQLMTEHQEWFKGYEEPKPTTFLQEKLEKLEHDYPSLHFDKTDKTGKLKCSKTSQWKLDDANCKDPFLDAYNNFKHAEKYMTTFCNREFIARDNKVHARFGIVNTGRSSCSKPNIFFGIVQYILYVDTLNIGMLYV